MNQSRPGLSPDVLEYWRRAIGVDHPLGSNPSRQIRFRGADALDGHIALLHIEPEDPEGFEQIAYWVPLTHIQACCILQTPTRTRRTPDLIREFPSNDLIIAVHSMGSVTGRVNGFEYACRPGQLTVTDNRLPYDVTGHGVTDPTGIWVPAALLGADIAAGATVPPIPRDTPLTRACAALVVGLAKDVAARGDEIDDDTELAAVEVVRATLQQELPDPATDLRGNPLYLREAVADLIEQHFRDPTFDADAIARRLHVSRRHLYRGLEGGVPLSETIVDRRLELARTLLADPRRVRLEGVALASGFSSAATLRNRFRLKFGMTPDEYRRSACATPTANVRDE